MQHLPIGHLIEQYGYWITFFGTVLEGDVVLVLSALSAHLGYLTLAGVIVVATIGATIGDTVCFSVGRIYGKRIVTCFPSIDRGTARANSIIERFPNASIILFRFIYGLKLTGAVLIGMSNITTKRFLVLNFIGSTIWATSIASLTYIFAATLTYTLGNIRAFEKGLFLIVLVAGTTYYLTLFFENRRKRLREALTTHNPS